MCGLVALAEPGRRFRKSLLGAMDKDIFNRRPDSGGMLSEPGVAMAASVEARVPFVHLPLARIVNAIPRTIMTPGKITKPLLKMIAERYLPYDLLHRRKVGLNLPVEEWLGDEGGMGRYLDDLSAPDCRLATYTDRARLRDVVARFRAGARAGLPDLVRLINVERWLRSIPAGAG